jgi:hypothetical protein
MEVDSSVDNSEEETKAMSTSDKKLDYLRNPPMSLPRLDPSCSNSWHLPLYADGEATDTNDEGDDEGDDMGDDASQVQHVDTLASIQK